MPIARLTLGLVAAALLAGCAGIAPRGGASAVKVVWPELVVHLHGAKGQAYLVDPRTDAVVATLTTTTGGALGTTTPDGKRVYVGSEFPKGDTVTVIDLDKRDVVARIRTGNRPKHPLVSPDGKWVLVNHWGLDDGKLRVTFIDTATNRGARNIDLEVPFDPGPTAVTSMHNSWSRDSRYAFTVERVGSHLVVIDTRDWSVRRIKVGSAPHYPVPSPDGKELWLVVEGRDRAGERPGAIVYDLPGLTPKARLDMPLEGQNVLEGHHGSFSQDGKVFFMLNRGPGANLAGTEIVAFDAQTKKLLARTATKSTGIGHAYNTPDGRWAYVSNAGDGNRHKIDMSTLTVVKEIRTGDASGGSQVLNVWTNVFEELPR